MSAASEYGVVNQSFYSGLNEIEKGIFIAHRDSMVATLPGVTIDAEILTFFERSSMKFVELLPETIRNIDEIITNLESQTTAGSGGEEGDDGGEE